MFIYIFYEIERSTEKVCYNLFITLTV